MKLLVALGLVVLVAGCSTPAATSTPGTGGTQATADTGGGEPTPDTGGGGGGEATQNTGGGNQSDNKAKARALIPDGATQLSEIIIENNYTVQVTSTKSLDELSSFWTQAIPKAGLSETGRFTASGTLTIAFTNPDGGVVASEDPSGGGVIITISVGSSQ